MQNPDILSASQLADFLGVTLNTVHNLTRRRTRANGEMSLPYIKVGRALKFRRASVEQWLAEREVR